jgi:hypothetical protein
MGVDPLTIGLAALSGLSSLAGSQAQGQQAKYQAQVARNNQAIANLNASTAARAGAASEPSDAWKLRGLIGQQQAAQAANGLDINSGSPAAVTQSTRALGNLGIAALRDNAARDYYGYKAQATGFANQAALAKASAPTPFSTLLGAASAVGGRLAKAPAASSLERSAQSASPYQLASSPRDAIDWVFI